MHNASNPLFDGWKTEVPVPYSGGVYRLQLNDQLYEGMRYVHSYCGARASLTPYSYSYSLDID